MCGKQGRLEFGTEVLVSYLPLSHIAAQLLDMYLPMAFGGTVYFAKPDALKVRTNSMSLKIFSQANKSAQDVLLKE